MIRVCRFLIAAGLCLATAGAADAATIRITSEIDGPALHCHVLNGGTKDVTFDIRADGQLSDTTGFGVSTGLTLSPEGVFILKPEDTSPGNLTMVRGHCTVTVKKGSAKTVRASACHTDGTTCVVHAEAR